MRPSLRLSYVICRACGLCLACGFAVPGSSGVEEYPIARAYADARVTRIYGGTSEIMKEIIGRDLGL